MDGLTEELYSQRGINDLNFRASSSLRLLLFLQKDLHFEMREDISGLWEKRPQPIHSESSALK